MLFILFLVCFVSFLRCGDLQDNGLFMVNINEKDEIVLFMMDLKTFDFEEKCNFGSKYTAAYKEFKDFENSRSGDGCIFMDDNQYVVFLHDDVNNRQSGDILKCQLDTKEVAKVTHYDFSCEYLFGGNGVDFARCASTMNSTGTVFYDIDTDGVEFRAQIPYIAVPESGNTCYWDRTESNYWCYLFAMKDERPVRIWVDTDLGGSGVDLWFYSMENCTHIYSIGRFDCNNMMAVIRYNKDDLEYKAIVNLDLDHKTSFKFKWDQKGEQNLISKASAISSNVITSCEYSGIVYVKVFDEGGIPSLIRYDWNTGEDSVIDASKIGSLTYMSQMACLFLRCDMHDNGLFMVNINEKDEIVLSMMDLKTFDFKENCNFGVKYTAAYKEFKDFENSRSGSGVIFMDANQYIVFLHDDVNNRQSGDILKCQLDTKEVAKVTHYDFSCEYLFGGGGVDSSWCASTMNSTGTAFYYINGNDVSFMHSIPYVAVPGNGDTCYWDGHEDNFWCYSTSMKDKRRTLTDTDLGGVGFDTWVYLIENCTEIYTIGLFDYDDRMAIIGYENDGFHYKAIVELNVDSFSDLKFKWVQKGEQNLLSKASGISSNVVAICEYSGIVYVKVFDEGGIPSLVRYDHNTGKDSVVDTSKFGSLTYMSQMTCL